MTPADQLEDLNEFLRDIADQLRAMPARNPVAVAVAALHKVQNGLTQVSTDLHRAQIAESYDRAAPTPA